MSIGRPEQLLHRGKRALGRSANRAFDELGIQRHRSIVKLYDRLDDLTMVERPAFVDNVLLASRGRRVEGDLVECGTWRGGISAAMAWAVPGRHSVLFDSFEGLPDARSIDGPAAIHWSTSVREYDNCSAEESWAIEAMSRVGDGDHEIVKGWFDDTLPVWAARQRPIAVLRLDGDWYDSTMACLEHLWPLVVGGGIVLVDDYYTWDGCARAVHDHLSRVQAAERIERSPRGVAYLVRRAG
jgi:O-methyltransferase